MRRGFRAAGTLVLVLVSTGAVTGSSARPAPGTSPAPRPAVALADELRRLYEAPGAPWERWGRRPSPVELEDGTWAPRDEAYRDRPEFVPAGALLLGGQGHDPWLGAWLLGTAPPREAAAAASALIPALRADDARVRFFAAHQLGRMAQAPARPALLPLALTGGPAESGVAHWALRRIAAALERPAPPVPPGPGPAFGKDFCRGVNWWQEEDRGDGGRASFRALVELGVNWISIHTWDPLQRGVHSPEWAAPRRPLEIRNLPELVRNAHAAGLKVMVKPHLEMRGYEPTEEERRILRGSDEGARRRLFERFRKEREGQPRVWHNDIEMKSEDDWRAWFARYEEYLLSYVRQAAEAGADAFCVGRETDKAAIAREADWRRLIARVRQGWKGPLTYSANFDGYERIPFWDALDVIGISAYFPLAPDEAPPSVSDLAERWEEVMTPLRELSRRTNRRVVFTEIGYPALATAARRPWEENDGPADVWMQARLYEAALRAISRQPFLAGSFFWLWEGTSRPPFRDSSFSIQDKPAAFVMGRFFLPGVPLAEGGDERLDSPQSRP